jgi:hypothetical protein
MATSLPKEIIDALPKQFSYTSQMGMGQPPIPIVPANATPLRSNEMGRNIIGYEIPLENPPDYPKTDAQGFPVPPLVAKYDDKGKLLGIESQTRFWADNEYHIQPEYSATGELIKTSPLTNEEAKGSFFSDIARDFGPMIAAAVGANLGLSSGLFPGAGAAGAAGGAAGGTGLTLGGSGLGLTGTAGTGLNLAATTGGGLGLTAGSAGAGLIGAGLGTALGAINTGIGAGAGAGAGAGVGTGVDYSLGSGAGTGFTTGVDATGGIVGGTGTSVDYSLGTGTGTGINLGGTGTGIKLGGTGIGTGVGTSLIDTIIKNPSIAGSVLGAATSLIGGANAPKEQTTTSSIDPQIKAEYLANLERAKQTAAGLEARQIAQPGQLYNDAERQLYNLGMTPFGEADIAKFFNPYQEQVVQGALGDIERTRLMQEQANRDQATRARAFGGSRQAVVSGMTNEAALRQAANTSAQLRSAGYTQAANLGLQARPMDIAGLQTSLGLGTTRTALEQARLDALRNLGTERLGITSGALGLQPANVGQTSSQPLYNNTAGSLLSGGLTGAYIGSLLGKA